MTGENPDLDEITAARREALTDSLEPISLDELKALGEELLPYSDNDWRELYFQFLDAHASDRFFRARTHDGFHVVYCPAAAKGIWFVSKRGIGPLRARGLALMKEVTAGR